MKVSKKKLPKSQYSVTVESTEEIFSAYRKKAVKNISQKVSVPGFRKGHIPEKMLIDRFGVETILNEAAEEAIPELLAKALHKEKLSPIERPNVEVSSLTPFTFTATVTVFPSIKVDKWEEYEIPRKEISLQEKDIDEVLKQLQERFIERIPVEREAKNGDFLEIDFSGKTPDGVVLDGTESKCHPLVLGSNTFIPGFEEKLIGMKKAEEKEFEVVFPKEYHAKNLAGKPVIFTVKVLLISEQKKPNIDDTLAQKVFGGKATLPEMKKEVEKTLREKAMNEERKRRENELIGEWEKAATLELPDVFVDEETKNIEQVTKHQAEMAGMTWGQYLDNIKKTEEEFSKEVRKEAEKRAKQRLIIGHILSEAKIEIADEEVQKKLVSMEMEHHHHDTNKHGIPQKGTEQWKQAEYTVRIEKLFDRCLEKNSPPKEKKEE
jgi:trigger factor